MPFINIDQTHPINLPHAKLWGKMNLNDGQITGLIGANGIGKTSLLYYLFHNWQEFKLSILAQKPLQPLSDSLSLYDVYHLIRDYSSQKIRPWHNNPWLQFFQFEHLANRAIVKLSGGENQVAKLIICLSQNADIFLLDEPTSFLHEIKKDLLIRALIELSNEHKKVLVIDHDKEFIRKCSQEVFIINDHHKIERVHGF